MAFYFSAENLFGSLIVFNICFQESIDDTYRYAHVFTSAQMEVALKLNDMMISSVTIYE